MCGSPYRNTVHCLPLQYIHLTLLEKKSKSHYGNLGNSSGLFDYGQHVWAHDRCRSILSNLSCLIVLESTMNYTTHQPQHVTGPCHMFQLLSPVLRYSKLAPYEKSCVSVSNCQTFVVVPLPYSVSVLLYVFHFIEYNLDLHSPWPPQTLVLVV